MTLDNFISQHSTARCTIDTLKKKGIVVSYWTMRRWRCGTGWPGAAMKQLLAAKGISA